MRRLVILAALALAGCAHASGPAVYVGTSCVPADYPRPPEYTDSDAALAAAPDFAHRYQLLAGNHALHAAREAADEKLIEACR